MVYGVQVSNKAEVERIWSGCSRFLTHHRPLSPKATLQALADSIDDDLVADMYGTGAVIEAFECRVATLLGMESAVFMPSGTMCQQIAMRIWTGRSGVPKVAMHPRNHLERPEHFGYQRLHGLSAVLVGEMDRLMTLSDLEGVNEPVGALLLELPQREIGGLLSEWDDLVAMTTWAREREIPVHMDGARLWESQPYYSRPLAELAGLFDSAYVSFYKGLGGISGAALAGPADVIAEARIWMRRHGGNLIRLYPFVLSAQLGLDEHLPRMAEYWAKAVEVGAELSSLPGVDVVPDPPQTNMMHVYIRGDSERLIQAALDVSVETGVWLFNRLAATPIPAVQRLELTVGSATVDISTDEIMSLMMRVIDDAGGS